MDAASACEGARDAIRFFESHSFKLPGMVAIEIRDSLPREAGPSAAGCFLEQDNQVLLVPYSALRGSRTWFNVTVDRTLYRSLAAHEVAHALAACNFAAPNPSIQAKEYVAYVAMFATMEPALRERVLKANQEPAFDNAERLTALLYMFDPMRFGVQAYRHFLGAGPQFLEAVFAGKALAD